MTQCESVSEDARILLMVTPFWSPLMPPLGCACLKSYLRQNGYNNVTIVDANVLPAIWDINQKYLGILRSLIPEDKQGNFNMTGYDVFMSHMMAHINYTNKASYLELVRLLVYNNFYFELSDEQGEELTEIIEVFFRLYEEYIMEVLHKEEPSVVGVSVYSVTLATAVFTFRLIKEKFPQVITVMGGGVFADQLEIHSSDFQNFLTRCPFIDKIISGEGELLFLKLLRGELPKNQRVYSLKDIENELLDLSSVDAPDFTGLETIAYTQMASYASRSCPFQCGFCSETLQWGRYRKKEPKQIVDELIALKKQFQRSSFLLGDSLINPLINDLTQEMIARNAQIDWDCYLRIDPHVCNPANTKHWREGGFCRARIGIESGSQHILDLMNKKIIVQQIKEGLASLALAGIKTTTYWVLGYPGENEQDFLETLALLEECKNNIYEADWHPFYFFPSGQVNSKQWQKSRIRPVYPMDKMDMLVTQTWTLDVSPSREEIYRRMCRFGAHCQKIGIPNPYSLKEIYLADKRWSDLHRHIVPC